MAKLCIHNATIVAAPGTNPGGIIIRDVLKIARITAPEEEPVPADNVIDAGGYMLFPGFIDAHVHMRDPGAPQKEDFSSGTASAACGGVTTVMCMPNTNPPVTDLAGFETAVNTGKSNSYVDFCIQAGLNASNLGHVNELWEAGVTSFEAIMSDAAENDLLDLSGYLEAAKKVEKTDGVLGVYTGSRELLEQAMKTLKRQGSGKHRFREFANTREPIGEALGIVSVTEICRFTRVKTVLRQTCTARGFEIARTARQDDPSLPLAVEVTPHHLHLTSRLLDSINGFAHMIPPLRTREDCQAAVSALADGTVDFVGSDHAPHEETLKAGNDPWSVPGGVPGLDTIVPAVLDLAAKGSISYGDVVRVLCERPAEIFGLSDRKGFLKPGADGDVVLVDPEIERKVERRDIISKAGRSPFEGYPLRGKMVASFLRGDIISENAQLKSNIPTGQFVPRGNIQWKKSDA